MSPLRPQTIACAALLSMSGAAGIGCDDGTATLTVRVQSGLRAGDEIRHVRARILRGAVSCDETGELASIGLPLTTADQEALARGTLGVAAFASLSPGLYTVDVVARRPTSAGGPEAGPTLLERCVVTQVARDRVLRVPLGSDCVNVSCPAPGGSAAFTECLNGRCVDPRCDADDPETSPLCCDRMLLGDACDTDPTLCRADGDCAPLAACLDPATCDRGVCVAPIDDRCGPGEYCDTERAMCVGEVVEPLDAGVLDAGPLDAGMLDAGTETVDAATDAAADDDAAPITTDAAIDGGSGRLGERCTYAGDEDRDGAADCADDECAGTTFCVAGCTPIVRRLVVSDFAAPAHWYRADEVALGPGGIVCMMRDLAGDADLLLASATTATRGTLAGQPAIVFASGATLSAPSDLGTHTTGGYSVVVVSQSDGPGMGSLVRVWDPSTSRVGFSLDHATDATTWQHLFSVGGSTFQSTNSVPGVRVIEALRFSPFMSGGALNARIQYYRDGTRLSFPLVMGSGLADDLSPLATARAEVAPGAASTIAEIVVHDRELLSTELGDVLTALTTRYPP